MERLKLKLKNNNLDDLEKYFLSLGYSNYVASLVAITFYKIDLFEIDLILEKIENRFFKEGREYKDLLNILEDDSLDLDYRENFGSTDEESIKRLDQEFSDFINYRDEFYKNIEVFKKQLLEISIVVQDDQK